MNEEPKLFNPETPCAKTNRQIFMKSALALIGASALLGGVIVVVGIWSDSTEHSRNLEAPPNATEEPVGMLEVQTRYADRSWTYVDGVLLAPSRPGMRHALKLTPGEHQVKLWLVDSSWGFEFYTLERSVVVEQGKVTYCELTQTDRLPSGWARSERAINYNYVTSWSDIISAAKSTPTLWEDFERREGWKAFHRVRVEKSIKLEPSLASRASGLTCQKASAEPVSWIGTRSSYCVGTCSMSSIVRCHC